MADRKKCDDTLPHLSHHWDEDGPKYHVCPGVGLSEERQHRYDQDLTEWRKMCAQWGPASEVTWRDEASFRHAWVVQERRLAEADRKLDLQQLADVLEEVTNQRDHLAEMAGVEPDADVARQVAATYTTEEPS